MCCDIDLTAWSLLLNLDQKFIALCYGWITLKICCSKQTLLRYYCIHLTMWSVRAFASSITSKHLVLVSSFSSVFQALLITEKVQNCSLNTVHWYNKISLNYIYIQLNALFYYLKLKNYLLLVGCKCNWTKMHGIHGIKKKIYCYFIQNKYVYLPKLLLTFKCLLSSVCIILIFIRMYQNGELELHEENYLLLYMTTHSHQKNILKHTHSPVFWARIHFIWWLVSTICYQLFLDQVQIT
jgi:hypothetical protein